MVGAKVPEEFDDSFWTDTATSTVLILLNVVMTYDDGESVENIVITVL